MLKNGVPPTTQKIHNFLETCDLQQIHGGFANIYSNSRNVLFLIVVGGIGLIASTGAALRLPTSPKSADNCCRQLVKFDGVDSADGADADNYGKKMSALLGDVGTLETRNLNNEY